MKKQSLTEQAMQRLASGEDAALGSLYDEAAPAVYAFLLRVSRDRSLAEDLTQETFLRIYRARHLYRPGTAVMPWAFTIARRIFLDSARRDAAEGHRRERARDPHAATCLGALDEHDAVAPSAEDLFSELELTRAVDRALDRLPKAHAAAFRLLKGEGLSVAETAQRLGTSPGAVKVRAHRACKELRVLLGRWRERPLVQ